MASAQCGMSVDQADVVVESLLLLNREFPADSKVLYITSRYYSELANRAARKLLEKAPSSAEAQAFMAEAYQSRGDFESATAKYRRILEQYPKQPGVHYQLGQIILAKMPTATEEAKKEFEAELEVNPTSPAAEYMLGDLAWRAMKIGESIAHFSRATELDVTLARPYLGLGVALNAAGRFTDAIDPLKKYVRLTPEDPAGYYQLAIAYSRIGNKQEAERQRALQLEAEEKLKPGPASTQDAPQPH
jgi:predicted Zn-dependent protease